MDMDSKQVATLSVDFYVQQIENNSDFIVRNSDMQKIVEALYNDAARFHWCLRPFNLMYYFVSFAIFIISASGTNTPSERGIKAVKYFGTPERNRMKGKSLNAMNHIHEKILEDDFNELQLKSSVEAAQACKTIMLAFGFHLARPTKQVYEDLILDIQNKTKYLDSGLIFYILHSLILILSIHK